MKKQVRFIAMLLSMMLVFTGCGPVDSEKNTENNKNSQSEMQSELQSEMQSEQHEDTEEIDSSTEDVQENTETETKLYAQTNVNVRSLPSTSGEKLGVLSKNQEVIALGESVDGWQKIRYNDGIAYVSAQYLGKTKIETQTTETQAQVDEITAEDISLPADFDPNGIVVVIDPGHQGKWNSGKEPDGPGSSTMKARVTSGCTGVASGVPEYKLVLEISSLLKTELENRGYVVHMTRSSHDVNISNMERAQMANQAEADITVRIHANSFDDAAVNGAETLAPSTSNHYVGESLAKKSQQKNTPSVRNGFSSAIMS